MPVRPAPPTSRRRRLERRTLPLAALAFAAFAGGVVLGAVHVPGEQLVVERFADAWRRGDHAAMAAQTTAGVAGAPAIAEAIAAATAVATIRSMAIGEPRRDGDAYLLAVTARTAAFGDVRGDVRLELEGADERARIRWAPHLAFPGVPAGARLERNTELPPRADLLARDNTALARGPDRTTEENVAVAESIVGELGAIPAEEADAYRAAGYPDDARVGISGLERILERELAGTPGGELRAGGRVLARRAPIPAQPVRTTLAPSVQEAALAALAGRLGGVVAMEPRSGEVLAAAGIAFSGLQPPGSTFKLVTIAGALQHGLATPRSRYAPVSSTTLEGVTLANANNEVCGGSLVDALTISCNTVFGPLGARLGARRLVATAERFGFNRQPAVRGAAVSTIPPPEEIPDDLALGATAIGQGRVQATTLQMTTVAAAYALDGRLPVPTLRYRDGSPENLGPPAMRPKVARQVRRMMVEVVRRGTGQAAALPGVRVAGKTGTAELRSTQGTCAPEALAAGTCEPPDPTDASDTTAWFVAFAPAEQARVAVGVMLVGAGAGGASAAPAARLVLQAALRRG